VCVFCFAISFPEAEINIDEARAIASGPESLITAIAPAPAGVAIATMVSVCIIGCKGNITLEMFLKLKFMEIKKGSTNATLYFVPLKTIFNKQNF
jgi:hypothetical protein